MPKIKKLNSGTVAELYNKYGIIPILLLVIIASSIASPVFLTATNLVSVLSQVAVTIVLTCGAVFVIVSGACDLAAGSACALCGVVCAVVVSRTGSILLSIVAAVVVSLICYALIGLLIAGIGLNFFIVTLAMQLALRGAAYLVTDGGPVYNLGGLSNVATQGIFGIPYMVIIALLVTAAAWFILSSTTFGRYMYAIGGNRNAAEASGINVKRNAFGAWIVMSVAVAISGILLTAETNSGQPAGAVNYEFDAIIACVLGGTSLMGGVGTVLGSVLGAVTIGIINDIMNLCSISAYYQSVVKGVIILLAILVDLQTRKTIMRSEK